MTWEKLNAYSPYCRVYRVLRVKPAAKSLQLYKVSRCRKGQSGVVLIMALLIVALVTTVVVSVSWRFELSMARNENRWHGAQARAYLEAAEMLTCLALKADFDYDPEQDPAKKIDHLGEDWAQPGVPYPVDEGWVRGTLEDAQSRFNLNLLVFNPNYDPTKNQPLDRYSVSQKRFVRLLQLIELDDGSIIDETVAFGLVEAIQDWIDQDNETSGYNGAEANYYESLDPPYPIANREMVTVSELSMVKGMTPELYTKLLPYVSALPGRQPVRSGPQPAPVLMNINTMKPLLFRTLNRNDRLIPLTEDEWITLLKARGGPIPGADPKDQEVTEPEGIKTVAEFFDRPEVKSILGEAGANKDIDISELGVQSSYFYLETETLVGEQLRRGKALLFRDPRNGVTKVIRRTSANY